VLVAASVVVTMLCVPVITAWYAKRIGVEKYLSMAGLDPAIQRRAAREKVGWPARRPAMVK